MRRFLRAAVDGHRIGGDRFISRTRRAEMIDQRHSLIAWYERRGYRIVEELSRDIVNYRSVVLSKTL